VRARKVTVSQRGKGRIPWSGVTEGRRRNMQANRSQDTRPELVVRRMLHALGYRYRLHQHDLPGRPDMVFPSRRKVIEVRGCFWHGHGCHPLGQLPHARADYWGPKIAGNQARDSRNIALLQERGWDVFEVWECRIRAAPNEFLEELVAFLGPPGQSGKLGSSSRISCAVSLGDTAR